MRPALRPQKESRRACSPAVYCSTALLFLSFSPDLADRYRINVVSPGWVAESRVAMGLEPMPGIWAEDLAAYYLRAVEGDATGEALIAEGPIDGGF